jgi:hypothetical protein
LASLALLPATASPSALAASPVERTSFYDAAVNVPPDTPGADGFAGGVRFHLDGDGVASVDVFLSRSEPVVCGDGTEDASSTTVRTPSDEATEPGPVVLDIDRRLRTARGEAVLDLLVTENPGCGAEEVITTAAAQEVSIEVVGTTVRFFSGIGGTVADGPDRARDLSSRLSRDGTGTLTVGTWLVGVETEAAFLVYGVDRSSRHGEPPTVPEPAAPAGGWGAQGSYAATFEPVDGLGPLSEDAIVSAAISAAPQRAATIAGSSLRTFGVDCGGPEPAVGAEFLEGAGPAQVTIDNALATATATATVQLDRWVLDACLPEAEPVHDVVSATVSLDLHATGPAVRVQDVRWHLVPGEGVETRRNDWFVAREAAGVVGIGDVVGETWSASIARAGR